MWWCPPQLLALKVGQIVDNKVLRIQTSFPLWSTYLEKFGLPQEDGASIKGSWHVYIMGVDTTAECSVEKEPYSEITTYWVKDVKKKKKPIELPQNICKYGMGKDFTNMSL